MPFAHPHLLWLLAALLPAMIAFFFWSGRKQRSLMAQFIQARLLSGLTVGLSSQRRRMRLSCLVLASFSLILALALPQWGFDLAETKHHRLGIVAAIDTSKNML